ncbi:LysM peptidoglycan-binding domain-containing protein [Effusibacillus pohliae]|uniref:LysM peptidoglycan-binding domain-containing protein n=1 Tax=Effusibacillus pohliae TaxID=232270 RepID=UPI00037A4A3F|nr:SafA/ExsA family spore coat assembly protein [Effusibacillus pohliae]
MKTHVVQPGDTLWKIAKAHGVPLASVIAANPQITDPDKIDPGMTVHVPTETENPAEPPPSAEVKADAGVLSEVRETPFNPFSMSEGMKMHQYVVQSGDTLWKIAKKTGHSLASIIAANPQIANPDLIMPGQVINIPDMHATGPGMPIPPESVPMHPKEKLMMPKPMVTAPKEVVTAPKPVLPPMPAPVHHYHHQDVDVMMLDYHPMTLEYHPIMLDYHPYYVIQPPVKVEVKPPKAKPVVTKPVLPKPVHPIPCPLPVYSLCPPGTHPFLMDEFGNLYPYPGYPYPGPHMVPTFPAPYVAGPAVAPTPGAVPRPPVMPPAMYPPPAAVPRETESAQDWHKSFPAMPQQREPEKPGE